MYLLRDTAATTANVFMTQTSLSDSPSELRAETPNNDGAKSKNCK